MTVAAMGSLSRNSASLWLVFPCVRVRMRSPLRLMDNPILFFLFPFLRFVWLSCRSRVCILSWPIRPSTPPPRLLLPHPFVHLLPPSSTWSAPPPLLRHPHLSVPHSSRPVMAFFFVWSFPSSTSSGRCWYLVVMGACVIGA